MKTQKKQYIDLHTHTIYSDGIYTEPELVVRMALLNGIDVLAITDHDSFFSYFLASDYLKLREFNKESSLVLIPGAEITTPDYHLLALNFNPKNKELQDFLYYSMDLQRDKCELRIQKLQKHGVPIDISKVNKISPGRIGKYNIFVAMMEDSDCKEFIDKETHDLDFYERFKYYMGRNGIVGDIDDIGVSKKDAIEKVHNAGGIIGIAHPPKDVKDISELDKLVGLGIDFLEVQPHFKDKYDYDKFEKYAKEHWLPISYGSDYHGPTFNRKMLEKGENVLNPDLEELLNQGYVKILSSKLEEVVC